MCSQIRSSYSGRFKKNFPYQDLSLFSALHLYYFFVLIVLAMPFVLTHTTQTSMPLAGFESAIPASDRPQTRALDRSATHWYSNSEGPALVQSLFTLLSPVAFKCYISLTITAIILKKGNKKYILMCRQMELVRVIPGKLKIFCIQGFFHFTTKPYCPHVILKRHI